MQDGHWAILHIGLLSRFGLCGLPAPKGIGGRQRPESDTALYAQGQYRGNRYRLFGAVGETHAGNKGTVRQCQRLSRQSEKGRGKDQNGRRPQGEKEEGAFRPTGTGQGQEVQPLGRTQKGRGTGQQSTGTR